MKLTIDILIGIAASVAMWRNVHSKKWINAALMLACVAASAFLISGGINA